MMVLTTQHVKIKLLTWHRVYIIDIVQYVIDNLADSQINEAFKGDRKDVSLYIT